MNSENELFHVSKSVLYEDAVFNEYLRNEVGAGKELSESERFVYYYIYLALTCENRLTKLVYNLWHNNVRICEETPFIDNRQLVQGIGGCLHIIIDRADIDEEVKVCIVTWHALLSNRLEKITAYVKGLQPDAHIDRCVRIHVIARTFIETYQDVMPVSADILRQAQDHFSYMGALVSNQLKAFFDSRGVSSSPERVLERHRDDNNYRIIFLCTHVPYNTSSVHLLQMVLYTACLARLDKVKEVLLISTNEICFSGKIVISKQCDGASKEAWKQVFRKHAGHVFENKLFVSINNNVAEDGYVNSVFAKIYEFDPDVICSWGEMFGSQLFDRALYNYFPRTFIQFNYSKEPLQKSTI